MNCKNTVSQNAGFVDGGILLSFVSDVQALHRSDMLNSSLLAQLAADKQYSRLDDVVEWYEFYLNTLVTLAWQTPGFKFQKYNPAGNTFTLEDVILSTLKESITDIELSLVKETIDTLRDLPNDDNRVDVFQKFGHSSHAVNVQVGVGNPSHMSTVGVVLKTKQQVERVFRERFSVPELDGAVETTLRIAALNEDVYETIRKDVIDRLGPRRMKELILDLDISGTNQNKFW